MIEGRIKNRSSFIVGTDLSALVSGAQDMIIINYEVLTHTGVIKELGL